MTLTGKLFANWNLTKITKLEISLIFLRWLSKQNLLSNLQKLAQGGSFIPPPQVSTF